MTLRTRLSLFFLTLLGIVLVGFSATLYLLGRAHLQRQAEERLDAAMNTLVAAAEVGPDGVEWEPAQRRVTLSQGPFGDEIVWLVRDDQGRLVDRSAESASESILAEASLSLRDAGREKKKVHGQGARWQLSQQWIQPDQSKRPQPDQANEPAKYPALVITAGVSLEPVRATLRQLLGVLVGLSVGIWLLALVLGTAISRRALRPLTSMTSSARAMDASDLGQRLPSASTADELEDLARAFNGLLDRLQESFERQRRFSGDASHQLRNPLAAMLGQLEVALRRERPPQEYQRVLGSVQRQALHLRQIVEALLFLARADAEARLPDLERLDLASWLTQHVRRWTDHPRAAELIVDSPLQKPLWVEAQEALLGQLVDILIENAIKFSDPGTPITFRIWSEPDTACLAIEDRGWGIAAADLPHLFEPFYRSPHARRNGVGGVGLGLAIAERIAATLKGRITVKSQPGQGSCFTLCLPRVAMPHPAPDELKSILTRPPQNAEFGTTLSKE